MGIQATIFLLTSYLVVVDNNIENYYVGNIISILDLDDGNLEMSLVTGDYLLVYGVGEGRGTCCVADPTFTISDPGTGQWTGQSLL